VQLSDVVFQQQQRIAPVKLMVANDKDGVLKLVNEIRIATAPPKRDSLTD
jgi:hypothetical protein